ncbi:hypothetical protein QQY24_29500 [Streptomyces sp. TG1A-8]|uniref:hypothetical protein n=1 Tax=Streptomyces sp. TG1A-8 TaxID=3051385 RepID=UPI00265C88CE|nr:hypothetical protein [Streptomyces sp. TG1A-8]MDO0929342.1 hypothetical protein [Streptomyces sp. TG1A-8]
MRSAAPHGDGRMPAARVRARPAGEEDFPAPDAVFDETFKTPFPARTTVRVRLPGRLSIEADLLAVAGWKPMKMWGAGPAA